MELLRFYFSAADVVNGRKDFVQLVAMLLEDKKVLFRWGEADASHFFDRVTERNELHFACVHVSYSDLVT